MAEKDYVYKGSEHITYNELCPACKEQAQKNKRIMTSKLCPTCKKIYWRNCAKANKPGNNGAVKGIRLRVNARLQDAYAKTLTEIDREIAVLQAEKTKIKRLIGL